MAAMERQVSRLLRSSWPQGGVLAQPIIWGYTVNVGPDGVPHMQQFGNSALSQEALEEGWREPFTTTVVDSENNVVRVTAELPGVTKDQLTVETLPRAVRIEAKGPERKYRAQIPIDADLEPGSAEAEFKNGILGITVRLATPPRPKGERVKVR
jgi:HSP20 family protein